MYDEAGIPISDAVVTIRTLDASVPYRASSKTVEGYWLIYDVPEGANIELVASKNGYTSRRQVYSHQVGFATYPLIVDFGSASNRFSSYAAYFLSDHPEIEKTEPSENRKDVDVATIVCKLRVSEPLSPRSRDNLIKALRIWPANKAAAGRGAADADIIDFVARSSTNDHDGTDDFDFDKDLPSTQGLDQGASLGLAGPVGFVIREGMAFRDDLNRRAKGVWDETGTELTFSFAAPLLAPNDADAKYQIGLVSLGANAPDRIEDLAGNQLGTGGSEGSWSSYPSEGRLIPNAFKVEDVVRFRASANPWAATHDSVVGFLAKRDEAAPRLLGLVVADDVQSHTRLDLTFSEPMVAFDGTAVGFASSTLLGQRLPAPAEADPLQHFAFALGANAGDTKDVALDGGAGYVVDPRDVATYGGAADHLGRGLRFAKESLSSVTGVATSVADQRVAQAPAGTVFLQVSPADPATVFLWILGRPGFFPAGVGELKAFAGGLADPAGNAIPRSGGAGSAVYALH